MRGGENVVGDIAQECRVAGGRFLDRQRGYEVVFVRPGLDALAITAIPQAGIEARSLLGTVVRISSQTSRPIRRCLRAFLARRRDKRM